MKKIVLPNEYNYVGLFLTLRCNYSCSYCVNEKSGEISRSMPELGAKQWIDCINRVKIHDDVAVTIGGGEPTMHRDFYEIVNGIKHPIDLLTNAKFDVFEFIKNVNPKKMFHSDVEGYKSVRISFHPEFMDVKEVVSKAALLQENGFNVGILPLNFPNSTEQNLKLAEEARKNMVYTFIKDYLGEYNGKMVGHYKYPDGLNGNTKSVLCRTKELLINPSGNVFKCHRDLYTNEYSLGSLLDNEFKLEYKFRNCKNFGKCNNCDLKAKVNRFLQMGSCSVEIQNLIGESWDT